MLNLSTRIKRLESDGANHGGALKFCAGKHGNGAGSNNRIPPFDYSNQAWSISLPFSPPEGFEVGESVETICQACKGLYYTIYQPFATEADHAA